MQIFKNPNYDFVRWRWHALVLSTVVILAGAFIIGTRGLQMGVDFEGGTVVILKFHEAPNVERITAALDGDAVVQRYGPAENNDVMIRVKRVGEELGGDISREVGNIVASLKAANVGTFEEKPVGTQIVGPPAHIDEMTWLRQLLDWQREAADRTRLQPIY